MFNRLKYDPSFIQRAVQLALRADQTTAKTAQDLDVKESTLYNWIFNANKGNYVSQAADKPLETGRG